MPAAEPPTDTPVGDAMTKHLFWFITILAVTTTAFADTILLTNGRRVDGVLIAVRGDEIEFEERSGFLRRVHRFSRAEVRRIELGDLQGLPDEREDRGDRGTAPPRGMRERHVQVLANQRWTDTGIEVRNGQTVYFSATGEVRWGPRNRRDTAAGERNSPYNASRPIPDRPSAALIGRIGEREDVFFIGADTEPFRMRDSGRLYLGINDDSFEDNSGAFRVSVKY
jgi:hypothetical protein